MRTSHDRNSTFRRRMGSVLGVLSIAVVGAIGPTPAAAIAAAPSTSSTSASTSTRPTTTSTSIPPTTTGGASANSSAGATKLGGGWSIPVTMTVVPSVDVMPGTTLNFSSTITNDTIFDGSISARFMPPMGNGRLGPISCTGDFRAGDSRTCSFQYQVTPQDAMRGQISSQVEWQGGYWAAIVPVPVNRYAYAEARMNPARLSLDKTATPTANVQAGRVVQFAFAGRNSGTTALTDVGITDPMAGLSTPVCTPAAPAVLAPGTAINCTADYTVTTADVANGSITNNASINGLDPARRLINASATTTVTTDRTPNLAFVKTASPTSGVEVGDVITYTFAMTNTGGTAFTSTQLTDAMVGLSPFTCSTPLADALPVGAARTCTATTSVTQADVDAGSIVNNATAVGVAPDGPVTRSASATVTAGQHPAIAVTVIAEPAADLEVGDEIVWTMSGNNVGDVTLDSDGLAMPMPGLVGVTCVGRPSLAPNANVRCTGRSTVTQADVDAGSVTNAVSFDAHDRYDAKLHASGTATATTASTGALALTKTASPTAGVRVGDTVTYEYDVVNTGTVTARNTEVRDPMPGLSALRCDPKPGADLAPRAALRCSATYRVTQADVDAGAILNTATATATDPAGRPLQDADSATVTADTTATFSLEKRADPASGVVTGTAVTYTMTGRNNGQVTLHGVRIADPKPGLSPLTCTPGLDSELAPGTEMTCRGTYTVTQADVEAGSITNLAEITGRDPRDNAVSATAPAIVTTTSKAEATFVATATPSDHLARGDVVRYDLTATNTGDRSLVDATITDPLVGVAPLACTPTAGATLAPAATIRCQANYTVTQADVDAGTLTTTATFAATAGSLPPVTRVATATITADQRDDLEFTKSAVPTTGVVTGSVIAYALTAKNAGTVTLHNVDISDPMPGLTPLACSAPMPATLAPDATVTCDTSYTVTQADVDAGAIENTATARALTPAGRPLTTADGATVTARQHTGAALTATASPDANVQAGDVITYSFDGHNTGTVTIHDVNIVDPMPGLSALQCTPAVPARLAATEPIHCAATYVVTQADVDSGRPILTSATLTGTDPNGRPVGVGASASVSTLQRASLGLSKTASPSTDVGVGETITYTYVATNSGTVTEAGTTIADPMPGLSTLGCSPGAGAALGALTSMTCTASYTVTQTDVDAGAIVNSAVVTGTTPRGATERATASATVFANQRAELTITKSASTPGPVALGGEVRYAIRAVNAGTVTLRDVTITDSLVPTTAIECTPTRPAVLAPGAAVDCTTSYTATQADVDAGTIVNVATATGRDPRAIPVSQSATVTTPTDHVVALELVKTASPTSGLAAGDRVTYTMTATNPGTVTLHDVTITDPRLPPGALECRPRPGSVLTPAASMTCTGEYRVTAVDVDTGSITNVATVAAVDPQDRVITRTATKTILAGETAALTMTKTATPDRGVVAGATIRYAITATNSGTVALHDVFVADPMPGLSSLSCTLRAPARLAVGGSIRCTARAVITNADVAAGTLRNTATAVGIDPVGNPTEARASASVDTAPAPPTPPVPPGPDPTPNPGPGGSIPSGSGTGDSGSDGRSSAADGSGGTTIQSGDDRFVTSTAHARSATRQATASGPEFAFSTADIGRLSALGLVGVIGGWFVIAAGRRRREEPDEETDEEAELSDDTGTSTGAAVLYLDRRQRRERRKLRNRLFRRRPVRDRRVQTRRRSSRLSGHDAHRHSNRRRRRP